MKAIFPLTEWSLSNRRDCWLRHLAVYLNSMEVNTDLEPVLLWRGKADHPAIKFIKDYIRVVESMLPFDDIMLGPGFMPQRPVEVSMGTLLKLEASMHFQDPQLIVTDVDCLWLRQPEKVNLEHAIAAGPQMYPGDNALNAGVTLIIPELFKSLRVLQRAQDEVRQTTTGSDEVILNRIFVNNWQLLPWEWRAFWSMPPRLPACVHFHGPKLDQIENLEGGRGTVQKSDAEIARLFVNGRKSLLAWYHFSDPYLNSPFPWYEQLTRLLR